MRCGKSLLAAEVENLGDSHDFDSGMQAFEEYEASEAFVDRKMIMLLLILQLQKAKGSVCQVGLRWMWICSPVQSQNKAEASCGLLPHIPRGASD